MTRATRAALNLLFLLLCLSCLANAQFTVPVSDDTAASVPAGLNVVQSRSNFSSGTSQTTITVSISSTPGHLLVAFVREGSNNADNFSVSDNLAQAWTTTSYNTFNTTNRSCFFYKTNSSAVTSVTATFTTSGGVTRPGIIVYEISGAATAIDPKDAGPVLNSTGNTVTSLVTSPMTTVHAPDILLVGTDVGSDQTGTNNSFAPPAGYGFAVTGSSTNTRQAVMYSIVNTVQTAVTATPGWGTGAQASTSFIAFTVPNTSPAALQAVTVNPTTVVGGNNSTGTVSLTNAAPSGGANVLLSSSDTHAQVPGSIVVPSGVSSANFVATTSAVTTNISAGITGTYLGVQRTANLTITPPSLGGWFAADSFLNTPVPSCAHAGTCIAASSAAWVSGSLINTGNCPGGGNTCEHLSISGYGVGVLLSTSTNSTVRSVTCTNYNTNSCNVGGTVQFPIPNAAGSSSIPSGSDHSMAFIYVTNDASGWYGKELDCWATTFNGTTWACDPSIIQNLPDGINDGVQSQAVKNNGWGTCAPYANKPVLNADGTFATGTNYGCTGSTASGISFAGGLLRAKEVGLCTNETTCATAVRHSLQFQATNLANTSNYACPATHQDTAPNHGAGTGAPQGTRFFLPTSYNIAANDAGWTQLEKAVAYALQTYGAYVQDYTGGGSQIQGETAANDTINGNTVTWSGLGIGDGALLSHIPWAQMKFMSGAYCNGAGAISTGPTYYVATTGNDSNAGTAAAPWRTIQHAANVVSPGDVIQVAAGTYSETILSQRSGTAAARIRFVSTTKWGAHVVSPATGGGAAWQNEASYVDIDGFDVTGSAAYGLKNQTASYTHVTNNYVHDIPALSCIPGGGIAEGGYSAVPMPTGNEYTSNLVRDVGPAPGTCNQSHGIYISLPYAKAYNNIVYNSAGRGIQLYHAATNVVVENNTIFGNGDCMVVNADSAAGYSINDSRISNNICYQNIGYGIYSGSGFGTGNQITNNSAYGNGTNWGTMPHTSDIVGDPSFINPTGSYFTGNYHLSSTSPAIGAGTTVGAPLTDFDGNPRLPTTNDAGAYRY